MAHNRLGSAEFDFYSTDRERSVLKGKSDGGVFVSEIQHAYETHPTDLHSFGRCELGGSREGCWKDRLHSRRVVLGDSGSGVDSPRESTGLPAGKNERHISEAIRFGRVPPWMARRIKPVSNERHGGISAEADA